MSDTSRLMTEQEAAKRLSCSVGLLRKMRGNGQGPAFYRLGGRLLRYSEDTLAEWLAAQRVDQKGNDGAGGQH